MGELIVGTRGSALALTQTGLVRDALLEAHPGKDLTVRIERITTTGDARADLPLAQLGRGVFVSEIETALRDGRVDFAVHSAKDMPSTLPDDLVIAAFLPRADARDVVISRFGGLRDLPAGARVGTSSPRRACLLRAVRPDVQPVDIRGNVDTRIRKLHAGEFDALILAAAGLIRLGRESEITEWLDPNAMIPSVGQGALAVEARAGDAATIALLGVLDDHRTRVAVTAERAFLAELGAGCRAAAAAHAEWKDGETRLTAFIGGPDGRHVRTERVAPHGEPAAAVLGRTVARELMRAGGARFLARGDSGLREKRIAITRAAAQSGELVGLLQANGAEAFSCPTIDIAPPDDAHALDSLLAHVGDAEWMVFTSSNAVEPVAARLAQLGRSLPPICRIAAIGDATAAAALASFGHVDFMPSRATAQALGRALPLNEGNLVLIPQGDIAREELVDLLRERGARVIAATAYRTLPGRGAEMLATLVRDGQLDAVVFTSPSTLRMAPVAVGELVRLGERAPVAVCIGPTTASAARAAGLTSIAEARTQSVGGIVEALERVFSGSATQLVAG